MNIASIVSGWMPGEPSLGGIRLSLLGVLVLAVVLLVMSAVGRYAVFSKFEKPPILAFVPFVSDYIWGSIVTHKTIALGCVVAELVAIVSIALVSGISVVVGVVLVIVVSAFRLLFAYGLVKQLEEPPVISFGLLLLPFIYWPYVGLHEDFEPYLEVLETSVAEGENV